VRFRWISACLRFVRSLSCVHLSTCHLEGVCCPPSIRKRASRTTDKNRGKHCARNASLLVLKDARAIVTVSFSYRLKSDLYGIKAMFGIYLTQTHVDDVPSSLVRVNDPIRVLNEDLAFLTKAD
jgi:hypothetical protein